MTLQKGFIPVIVLVLGILVLSVAGAGGAALLGQAPKCPSQSLPADEKALADQLDKTGSITVSDAQATSIAQKYLADKVENTGVCFTAGLAHASGNIKLGPFNPSFYASTGIDLSGSTPRATNLDIKVGSLPDIPVVSGQVKQFVTNLINENLGKVQLKKKYHVNFSAGSTTVTKLSN